MPDELRADVWPGIEFQHKTNWQTLDKPALGELSRRKHASSLVALRGTGAVVRRTALGMAFWTSPRMIAALPGWLEGFLGVKSADTGEGTTWSVETSWSWAPWFTLLFVVCAVTFVALLYSKDLGPGRRLLKVLLIGMRLTLIGLLLLMIAEVVLSLKRTGLPYVVVMVDDSGSMGIADRYSNEKLRALLEQQLTAAGLEATTRLNLAKAVLVERQSRVAAPHRARLQAEDLLCRRRGTCANRQCRRIDGGLAASWSQPASRRNWESALRAGVERHAR